ncbi:MAG TPA: fucose isomerase, partial [Acidobacteriota bacterium]|nr:fucose isomerase [Acidobacteriota bacterium]
ARDLEWFAGVCRVVKGLRHARLGAIGARPANFNTVRYSEKLLEASGISVEPVDLAEILGRISRLDEQGSSVRQKIEEIREYTPTQGVPENALVKMAKLAVAVEQWMQEVDVQMSAIQCWTTLEQYYGVVPCTVMSMMSNSLIPAACEVDVCGVIAMYALQLASGTPSALLDWNNNYADDPDKVVCFHCSNLPRHFFADTKMGYQDIIAGTVGKDATFGTVLGRVRPSPMTFARFSTDDQAGLITGYLGEGRFTDDPLETFGGYGVVEIPRLQELLHFICAQGFEHHVAASLSQTARILYEATTQYMDWEIYWHQ